VARPPLAICIPTYRRPGRLARLLEALAAELEGAEQLPVLVSDNCSGDETEATLAAARRPGLRTHRQPRNLGPNENIRWLLRNAPDADYVWCIGDDDAPAPGAVAEILALLAAERPAWLHLPHRWIEPDGRVKDASPVPASLETFATAKELYTAYGHWLSFMSANVVRRDEAARSAERTVEISWAPFVWLYRAAAAGDGPCVVPPLLLVEGDPDISWRDRESEVLTRDFVGLYDEVLAPEVAPAEFAEQCDRFYRVDAFADHWATRPREELAVAVERFPQSRRLRAFLWRIAFRERRSDLLRRLDAAARATGAGERADAEVAAGERLFEAGDAAGAAEAFLRAVSELPTHAEGWNDLAVAWHALGDRRAAEAITAALLLDPTSEDAVANYDRIAGARG